MDKNRIKEALSIINQEIDKDSFNVDIAYQIYCQCNCFIAHEIKRIIKEEGSVTKEHPEIAPLFKLFESILPVMKRFSKTIEEKECLTINN